MKKMKGIFLILFFIFAFLLISNDVKAETLNSLSLKAVKCPLEQYISVGNEALDDCYYDYLDGKLDDFVIDNGGSAEPGTTIMFIINYSLIGTPETVMFGYDLYYDKNVWNTSGVQDENIYFKTDLSTFPGSTLDRRGNWSYKWYIYGNLIEDGKIYFDGKGNYSNPLNGNLEFGAFFLTLKENVNLSSTKLSFGEQNEGELIFANLNKKKSYINAIDFTINASNNGTLKELEALGNDGINYLENNFISSSKDNLEYSFTVPNYVDKVMFKGKTTEENVQNIDGLDKNNNLNFGSNIFNITITAENGDLTIYKIIIKREQNLNNSQISSSIYNINRFDESENEKISYVIGIEPKTKLKDFLKNFTNDKYLLHIYDIENNEIINENTYVGSNMKLKLVYNGILDELNIIVRGDFDGDGLVTVIDENFCKDMLIGIESDNYINVLIGDITLDGAVMANDTIEIKNYLVGKGNLN